MVQCLTDGAPVYQAHMNNAQLNKDNKKLATLRKPQAVLVAMSHVVDKV